MSTQRIGTVTLLRDRVYDEMIVPTGSYPIMRTKGGYIYFQFSGYPIIPAGKFEPRGNGIYSCSVGDRVKETKPQEFRSRSWSAGEWMEFLAHPLCQPGEEQRLIIQLDQGTIHG